MKRQNIQTIKRPITNTLTLYGLNSYFIAKYKIRIHSQEAKKIFLLPYTSLILPSYTLPFFLIIKWSSDFKTDNIWKQWQNRKLLGCICLENAM